jgi:hypothetical protein
MYYTPGEHMASCMCHVCDALEIVYFSHIFTLDWFDDLCLKKVI